MIKLRDDVRSAFERDQSRLGDIGYARDQLMHRALTAREAPASHRLQWAATVAAVLIAVIVITTFALIRGNARSHAIPAATPSPRAQASPTPLRNTLSVPDSTPLVLYSDPVNPAQLDGVTWDGKTSGKMRDQQVAQVAGPGNPQNNLFGGPTTIVDRSGNTIMTGTYGAKFFGGAWADDGRHFCQVVPFDNPGGAGIPTTLQLVTVGGDTRDIVKVGTLYNQTTVHAAACSTSADRAVVVQSGGQGVGTAQVWVIQLSTGHVIWTYSFDPTHLNVQIVASRDAMYVAADVTSGTKPSGSTVFGPDGSAAAHLQQFVEQFSWDDTLAVVDEGYGTTPVDVISWRVGTMFWSCPPGTALVRALPEPDGTELAIWVAPTTEFQQQTQSPDLIVVAADGSIVFSVVQTSRA